MRKVPTNNQHLFYQPKDVWVGDVMPFGKDGTFYLYHQRDTRDPAPLAEGQPFGWSLATTQDFVTYQEHGTRFLYRVQPQLPARRQNVPGAHAGEGLLG